MLGTRFTKALLGTAVVGALALGLTACGSSGSGSSAGGSDSSSTAAKGGKRSIDTAFGAVEVPAEAKKVVALNDTSLDTALALGVTPVGTSASRGGTTAPAYLKADAVPLVATVKEPNIEAILKAAPTSSWPPRASRSPSTRSSPRWPRPSSPRPATGARCSPCTATPSATRTT